MVTMVKSEMKGFILTNEERTKYVRSIIILSFATKDASVIYTEDMTEAYLYPAIKLSDSCLFKRIIEKYNLVICPATRAVEVTLDEENQHEVTDK